MLSAGIVHQVSFLDWRRKRDYRRPVPALVYCPLRRSRASRTVLHFLVKSQKDKTRAPRARRAHRREGPKCEGPAPGCLGSIGAGPWWVYVRATDGAGGETADATDLESVSLEGSNPSPPTSRQEAL